jgi:hypothetical protein
MSLQVGSACFANPVDAGAAACSAFLPVSAVSADGSQVRTVSCGSADPSTGALILNVATVGTTSGATSTSSTVSQLQAFPSCTQQDYVDAYQSIFLAVLGVLAVCLGPWWLHRILTTNARLVEK